MAGLAGIVTGGAHLVRVVEVTVVGVAWLNTVGASQHVGAVAGNAFSVGGTSAVLAGFVARKARTFIEVFARKTISTVVVIGSAASVAGEVAWGADIRAKEIRVFFDESVTILTFSSRAASSGAVALAVTVTFNNVALVEDVIVGDAVGWDTSTEL